MVDIIIFGYEIKGFQSVLTKTPEKTLIEYLKVKKIDGIVRGQLDALTLRQHEQDILGYKKENILELNLLGKDEYYTCMVPAVNSQGWGIEQKIKLADEAIKFWQTLKIKVKIGVLTGVRPQSLGKNPFLDPTYYEAEALIKHYKNKVAIKNYNIEFEKVVSENCNIVIEQNGLVGNQVFRSLTLVGGWEMYGAVTSGKGINDVIIESLRNMKEFTNPILLCAALLNIKK